MHILLGSKKKIRRVIGLAVALWWIEARLGTPALAPNGSTVLFLGSGLVDSVNRKGGGGLKSNVLLRL